MEFKDDIVLDLKFQKSFMNTISTWAEQTFSGHKDHIVYTRLNELINEYEKPKPAAGYWAPEKIADDILQLFKDILLIFHESGHAVYSVKYFPRERLEIDYISFNESDLTDGGVACVCFKPLPINIGFCGTFDERKRFIGRDFSGFSQEPYIELEVEGKSMQIGQKWEDQKPDQLNSKHFRDKFFSVYSEDWSEDSFNYSESMKLARLDDCQSAVKSLAMYVLEEWNKGRQRIEGDNVYRIVEPLIN
jgi:Txe/YoeB family toxin of Txe-Axe toxin-antitoxin module